MKRTKNQGGGIVVKAQYSDFLKIFASMRFILIAPEILRPLQKLLIEAD